MKTIEDFKIINGVAVLEGVAYAEEAKVVDEFVRNNVNINYASVVTKDKRYFKLENGKLIFTNEEKFINPYYSPHVEIIEKKMTSNSNDLKEKSDLEFRVVEIENTIISNRKLMLEIISILSSFVKK